MNKKKVQLLFVISCLCAAIFVGCGNKKEYNDGKNYYSKKNKLTSEEPAEITNSYDAKMLALVKNVNPEVGVVVMINIDTGAEYTMTYGESLQVIDRYGENKTLAYLSSGDIVYAYYLKSAVQLTGVAYSSEIWAQKETDNWQIDAQAASITVNRQKYYYNPQEMIVLSEGELVQLQDLNQQDKISVRGTGKKALVISVDRGHGYLRLEGIQHFIDGWVQIEKIIKPISENMLLVVPEGTHDVKIVKDGYGGALSATIARNQEVTLDFTDISAKIVRYGTVEFSITPAEANAKLYIAGQETNYSVPILLEYDSYKVQIKADGYKTYNGTLKVGENLQQIDIELEKADGSSESPQQTERIQSSETPASAKPEKTESVAPDSTPAPTATVIATATETPTTVGAALIIISDPVGANVYFDDEYKGVVPISFPKVSGTHTLTLTKPGCETKSYTLDINYAEDNVTYCMPALEPSVGAGN